MLEFAVGALPHEFATCADGFWSGALMAKEQYGQPQHSRRPRGYSGKAKLFCCWRTCASSSSSSLALFPLLSRRPGGKVCYLAPHFEVFHDSGFPGRVG
jgi:hypothetical protein